jgi:single-strand DNA-binding protein
MIVLPQVSVEGRIVADPELRFAPSGVAVGRFRVAASSRKKNDNDEWVDDKTLWLSCTCFKQLAENVAESVVKGDLVVVNGRLQTDEWETQDGEKRSQIVCIADSVAVSVRFRTIRHGESSGAQRAKSRDDQDPWSTGGSDEPPF